MNRKTSAALIAAVRSSMFRSRRVNNFGRYSVGMSNPADNKQKGQRADGGEGAEKEEGAAAQDHISRWGIGDAPARVSAVGKIVHVGSVTTKARRCQQEKARSPRWFKLLGP